MAPSSVICVICSISPTKKCRIGLRTFADQEEGDVAEEEAEETTLALVVATTETRETATTRTMMTTEEEAITMITEEEEEEAGETLAGEEIQVDSIKVDGSRMYKRRILLKSKTLFTLSLLLSVFLVRFQVFFVLLRWLLSSLLLACQLVLSSLYIC